MRAHRRRCLRDAQGGGEAGLDRAEEGRRLNLQPVSATAFWTAYCRALDGDALAAELCGEEGAAIGGALEERGRARAAIAARTAIVDRLIFKAISQRGVETVVSLGCGLDTRALRWTGGARWIEVDAPEVIAWKEERLRARRIDPPTFVAADLEREESVAPVMETASGPTLVVAEGVLQYLETHRVRTLLRVLRRRGAPTTLVADVGGGAWARMFGSAARVARSIGAPYRTRIGNAERFFSREGWHVVSAESISDWFLRPFSAWVIPGWSSAARVVEVVPSDDAAVNAATRS